MKRKTDAHAAAEKRGMASVPFEKEPEKVLFVVVARKLHQLTKWRSIPVCTDVLEQSGE